MYFAGKTYFQGENLQVVETPKPKPRRKGDVAKKVKEGKIDITKLKKQFGNDIIMMLLLKLLGNDKKEKVEKKEKKPRGMKRSGRGGGGGGGGGFQTQKSLAGQRANQNKAARLSLVGQQKETETDPEYLKRILREVLVDDPIAGAFVDSVVPKGEGDTMPQTAPAFKDSIGQLVKYQDILRKGTFEGKALTKKKRQSVERSVIRSLEQVAGEVSDKFITTSKDRFIGRGVDKATEVLRTIYGNDYKPPDGKDYDIKIDEDGSVYSEDRQTRKRGRGRPRKEVNTDSEGSASLTSLQKEQLARAKRAADTINEANRRDEDVDSSVRSDEERSVEFYQELSQRKYNLLDERKRARFIKTYVNQLPKGLPDTDEAFKKYTRAYTYPFIDRTGVEAEGVIDATDIDILKEYQNQGKQSRRGLKIPTFEELNTKSLIGESDFSVYTGVTDRELIDERIRRAIALAGGRLTTSVVNRRSPSFFQEAPNTSEAPSSYFEGFTEEGSGPVLGKGLVETVTEEEYERPQPEPEPERISTPPSSEISGQQIGVPQGTLRIPDEQELILADIEQTKIDRQNRLDPQPEPKTKEEFLEPLQVFKKGKQKRKKTEENRIRAYEEIEGVILSIEGIATQVEIDALRKITQDGFQQGKNANDTLRKIQSRIDKIGRGETIKELKDPKKESMKTRVGPAEIIKPFIGSDGLIDPTKFVYIGEDDMPVDSDIKQDIPMVADLYALLGGANKTQKKQIQAEINRITKDYTYQLRKEAKKEQAEEVEGFAENDVDSEDGDFLQTADSSKKFVKKGLDVSDEYKKGGMFALGPNEEVVGWGEKGFKVLNEQTGFFRYIPSKPLTGADKINYDLQKQKEELESSSEEVGSKVIGDGPSLQESQQVGDSGSVLQIEDKKTPQEIVDADFLGSGSQASSSTVLGPSEEDALQQQIRNRFLQHGLVGFKETVRDGIKKQLNLQDVDVLGQSESESSPEDLSFGTIPSDRLRRGGGRGRTQYSSEDTPSSSAPTTELTLDEKDNLLLDLNEKLSNILEYQGKKNITAVTKQRLENESDYDTLNTVQRRERRKVLRAKYKQEVLDAADEVKAEIEKISNPPKEILDNPLLERQRAKDLLAGGFRGPVVADRLDTDFDEDPVDEEDAASEPLPERQTRKEKVASKSATVKQQLKIVEEEIEQVVEQGEVLSSDAAAKKLRDLANRKELLNADKAQIERDVVLQEDANIEQGEDTRGSKSVVGDERLRRKITGKKLTKGQRVTELIKTFNTNPQFLSPEERQRAQNILAEREIGARIKSGDLESIEKVTQDELRLQRKQVSRNDKVSEYLDRNFGGGVEQSIDDSFNILDVFAGGDIPESDLKVKERETRERLRGITDSDMSRINKQRKTLKATRQYTAEQIEDILAQGFASEQVELVGGLDQVSQGKVQLPSKLLQQGSDEGTASFEEREKGNYKKLAIEQAIRLGKPTQQTPTGDLPAPRKIKKTTQQFDSKISRLEKSLEKAVGEERVSIQTAIRGLYEERRINQDKQQKAQTQILLEDEANSSGYDALFPSETPSVRRERKRPDRISKISIQRETAQVYKDYMDKFQAKVDSGAKADTQGNRDIAETKAGKLASAYEVGQEKFFGFRKSIPFQTKQTTIPIPARTTPLTDLGNHAVGTFPEWLIRKKQLEETEEGLETLAREAKLRQIGTQPTQTATKTFKEISELIELAEASETAVKPKAPYRGKPFKLGGKVFGYIGGDKDDDEVVDSRSEDEKIQAQLDSIGNTPPPSVEEGEGQVESLDADAESEELSESLTGSEQFV